MWKWSRYWSDKFFISFRSLIISLSKETTHKYKSTSRLNERSNRWLTMSQTFYSHWDRYSWIYLFQVTFFFIWKSSLSRDDENKNILIFCFRWIPMWMMWKGKWEIFHLFIQLKQISRSMRRFPQFYTLDNAYWTPSLD